MSLWNALIRSLLAVAGIVFGLLSAVALAAAAILPAILGLFAFLLSPLRALIERLRRLRVSG